MAGRRGASLQSTTSQQRGQRVKEELPGSFEPKPSTNPYSRDTLPTPPETIGVSAAQSAPSVAVSAPSLATSAGKQPVTASSSLSSVFGRPTLDSSRDSDRSLADAEAAVSSVYQAPTLSSAEADERASMPNGSGLASLGDDSLPRRARRKRANRQEEAGDGPRQASSKRKAHHAAADTSKGLATRRLEAGAPAEGGHTAEQPLADRNAR